MFARLRPALVISSESVVAGAPNVFVVTENNRAEWPDVPGQEPMSRLSPVSDAEPAYIMFTSGSTGEPKGAVIPHRGVLSLMRWVRRDVFSQAQERFTNFNPIYFDNSVFDLFGGLLNGAPIVPVETAAVTNPASWVRLIRAGGATVMFAVPTLFLFLDQIGLLTPEALPGVRTFLFGGEGYPVERLREFRRRFHGHARLINVYGPTETSCICSSVEITEEVLNRAQGPYPELGRMHEDFSYAVLDPDQRPVAPGESGELWIGGPCVGMGYYGNPEETAVRFLQDPAQDRTPSIFYRSGDAVRQDEFGRLWFQGRIDNQVKIRGFRVELEEIDHAVQGVPDVRRAASVKLETRGGPELGVAFVADRAIAPEEIRKVCGQKLPSYMQPTRIVQLPELPRNANGKVDRRQIRSLIEGGIG
jgi:D-alanine--poly(phosphoribitol) ligase subunit 1